MGNMATQTQQDINNAKAPSSSSTPTVIVFEPQRLGKESCQNPSFAAASEAMRNT
jgi:hypothetical protein